MPTVEPDTSSHRPNRIIRHGAVVKGAVPRMNPRSKDGQVNTTSLNTEQGFIPDSRVRSGVYGGTSGTGAS